MKGFIIFNNESGQLLYSKNYNCMPFTSFQNSDSSGQQASKLNNMG